VNVKSLTQFAVLAEHLHFGQASAACNISVSAMSRNIQQLEEAVGARLFERDNRAVSLTDSGEKFLPYALEATRQWRDICRKLNTAAQELSGEIRLYCSVTASYSILFDLLNRLRPDFPGIEIKLHTGDPEHAIERIVSKREDIAIAPLPKSAPRGVLFKRLTDSPLVFIAAKDSEYEIPRRRRVGAKVWSEIPMILSESGIARTRVNEWFKAADATPKIYAQVAGNEAIVSMVSLGLGVGVVPKIVIDNSPMADKVRIVDVQPPLAPYQVGLVVLKKSLDNPLVNAFWSFS